MRKRKKPDQRAKRNNGGEIGVRRRRIRRGRMVAVKVLGLVFIESFPLIGGLRCV